MKASLGLDFGTLSVRALVVGLDGQELGSASCDYARGVITGQLPTCGDPLPPDSAFQHPDDWLDSAATAIQGAARMAGQHELLGIGVAFTSCTMLPLLKDGRPLCLAGGFEREPQAWPKLWKHHGAIPQAVRMTTVAREHGESFLARYGGVIGEEWLFPKILEAIESAPRVADAAAWWMEAGDWVVWQMTGGEPARSTCQAGYKGLWSAEDGDVSNDYLAAVHPRLPAEAAKLPRRMRVPGEAAGLLCPALAERFGIPADIPVGAAAIDAHAGVPGAGASEPDTLVMVLGTSSCHMLNSTVEATIPGVAGVVRDGILPGFHGYETGQAAVGDAFDWLRRLAGENDFSRISREAAALPPGAGGVRCLDWFNGCRTPWMDGTPRGAFTGLSLQHGPAHLHRAVIEATACGLRWIISLLREGGVPVKRFIATGGLPHHDPLLMQIYADVIGEEIAIPPARQGPALGAAIFGALAGGAFPDAASAIRAMTSSADARRVVPGPDSALYGPIYDDYRSLADIIRSR